MGYEVGVKNKKSFTRENILSVNDVQEFPIEAIKSRGITKETCEHFGVRTEFSKNNFLTPIAHYFPYHIDAELVGYKKRDLTVHKSHDYHFTTIDVQGPKCDFFGAKSAPQQGRMIWVCEGEYDAMILWQCLKQQAEKKGYSQSPAVVSITNGCAAASMNVAQRQNMRLLENFDKKIFAFDNDRCTPQEAVKGNIIKGREALNRVYGVLPDIYNLNLPEDQDIGDYYKENGEKELYFLAVQPKIYKPEGFITYADIEAKAKELPKLGKPWPWPSLTKLTLGRRVGEGYFIGAGVKIGKSEFVNKLAEQVIEIEKQKIALFKLEEEPEITCKKVAGKMRGYDFTNPERVLYYEEGVYKNIYGEEMPKDKAGFFTQEILDSAVDAVGDNVIYYNRYGSDARWDDLKGAIKHAVLVQGCTDIVIDPLTRITTGMDASRQNQELETFSDEISKMSKDFGFTYYVFCHLKAPESGPPHELGGKVHSNQFFGSRAMMRTCYYTIGLERNKDPDIPLKERSKTKVVILDDRKYGRNGYLYIYYDPDTGDYIEPPEGFFNEDLEDVTTVSQFNTLYPNGVKTEF